MLFQLQIYKFCTDKRRKVVFLYENKLQYGFVIVNIFLWNRKYCVSLQRENDKNDDDIKHRNITKTT